MAQGPAGPLNRLDNLTVSTIMNRILAAPPLLQMQDALKAQAGKDQASAGRFRGWGGGGGGGGGGFRGEEGVPSLESDILAWNPKLPSLTDDEKAVLALIAANPTTEELADLAMIDGFFPGPAENQWQERQGPNNDLTQQICEGLKTGTPVPVPNPNPGYQGGGGGFGGRFYMQPTLSQLILAWLLPAPLPTTLSQGGGGWRQPTMVTPTTVSADDVSALKKNPFYCGPAGSYSYRNPSFGIDTSQPWGAVKLKVKQSIIVGNTIAGFPFPPPIDQYLGYFWNAAHSDIQTIISTPTLIDPKSVKYWITLFVIAHYNEMVDRIQSDLKKEAKKKKRKMIIQAIGLAVLGIVAAIVLPAVIAAAVALIKTAITTYISIEEQKKAARAMADSAKLFEKDAPAFSAEAQDTAKMLDEVAAVQQYNQKPSPEMQDALNEVAAETPSTGVSPLIPIGGGVAAAGLAAFLLFR